MEAIDLKRTKYQVLDVAESIGCEEIAGCAAICQSAFTPAAASDRTSC
jgi:hypothetical protein